MIVERMQHIKKYVAIITALSTVQRCNPWRARSLRINAFSDTILFFHIQCVWCLCAALQCGQSRQRSVILHMHQSIHHCC